MAKKTEQNAVAVVVNNDKQLMLFDDANILALQATDDYDNMSRADVAVPFLKVLQALSPECTPGSSDYRENARPGMIAHSITKDVFQTVEITPVVYKRSYLEWVPRNKGGGFRGEHPPETHEQIYNRCKDPSTGKCTLDNGNDLIETLSFFCLLHGTTVEPVIISMSSTQTKTARQWNQMQQRFVPPGAPMRSYKRCIARYTFATDMQRNDKGAWYTWRVAKAVTNDPDTINMALEFERQIKGGTIVVDRTAMEDGAQSYNGNSDM